STTTVDNGSANTTYICDQQPVIVQPAQGPRMGWTGLAPAAAMRRLPVLAPFGHAAAITSCLLLGKNGPGSDAAEVRRSRSPISSRASPGVFLPVVEPSR